MNKIYTVLIVISLALLSSCSSEPKSNIKDESGALVENRGPIYKTSACKDSDKESLRQCGDVNLVKSLEQLAIETVGDGPTPSSSKLVIVFDVLTSGKTGNIEVTRSMSEEVDNAAINFIKKTRWEPAVHDGKEQKIQRRFPLTIEF